MQKLVVLLEWESDRLSVQPLGAFLVGRPGMARWTLSFAFAIGAIAFLAGFAGPILLAPDSPQGPLLGIFVTGSLGFMLGAAIGLAIGVTKSQA